MVVKRLGKLFKNELLAFQGLKYSVLRRRQNIKKQPIKLYWWHDRGNGIVNFGDEITKDILMQLFGYRSIHATQNEAELIGAGSILEIASNREGNNEMYVWGSGFMWKDEQQAGRLERLHFCAVRGTHSRDRLGVERSGIALGDPGLLANIVYKKSTIVTDKIGIVAHFVDANEPLVQQLREDKRFKMINPLRSPEEVAFDITSCKLVLSSSLHGLIFADSFNIPNMHIQLSGNVAGGTYKFEDYYSATNRIYRGADVSRVFDKRYLEEISATFQPVDNLRKIQKDLVRSFPKIR